MRDSHEDHSAMPEIVRLTASLPKAAVEMIKGRIASWKASQLLIKQRRNMEWKSPAAHHIREQLERIIQDRIFLRDIPLYRDQLKSRRTEQEKGIIQEIEARTAKSNRSNITRTRAYLNCYKQFPELHWSFLAHMVSRNAGWSMSDLKGGLMSDLMEQPMREDMYRLLERCNALIFQDAYPQLLLYMYSRTLGKSLFHLLSEFHVSAFMHPFWERFWLERDSALLATGLIINEQQYIEGRVVQHHYFQKQILRKPSFLLHSKFQMNQIIFPLTIEHPVQDSNQSSLPQATGICGLILEDFTDIHERIEFGKSLYAMLFGYQNVLSGVQAFAFTVKHQGSRQEYWPALFTADKQTALNSPQESSELLKQEWLPEGKNLYSPLLKDVWQDMPYEPIQQYDWFTNANAIVHITRPRRPLFIEMTHAHRLALQKTAMIHDVQKAYFPE
ncbi:DUF2515 family protein [Paenibacillus pini]|uniref:DUF2515 domain-containing protein n=1 Tax=Paenibacillus pini JCM 16418 TaxID=1236976 RepID=W7YM20_9BACL|nr:DUF2515 family protein [Paenibacillus pini]GAF08603.1 hypothetical protein JCM16418_2688 [Paenibacillus pini JCM 16418]